MSPDRATLQPQNADRRNHRRGQQTRKDYAPPLIDPRRRSRKRAVAYTLGFLAALAGLAALLATDANSVETPETGMATATIEDINDNPELYEGRHITVVGEAPAAQAEQAAFTLDDGDALLSDALLVINAGEAPLDADGERWRATGRLEVYDGGSLDGKGTVVGGGVEVGDPVLIAQKVVPVPPPTVGW